jgi:hypothetical protein
MRNDPQLSRNHKEKIMRGKIRVTIGLLAMIAVTGVVTASSSMASDAPHVAVTERIGHGGSTYQPQFEDARDCRVKVDRVERLGAGGSTYSSNKVDPCGVAGEDRSKVNVMERIGHGGSIYSSGQSMS